LILSPDRFWKGAVCEAPLAAGKSKENEKLSSSFTRQIKEKTMKSIDLNRRHFMKIAGGSLIAAAAGSSLSLSAM